MAESNAAPRIEVSSTSFVPLFDKDSELICVKPSPLPGIVIFVHGVNSEGEWFTAAEQGLCAGLNRRIGRLDDQVDHPHGQLKPAQYIESLTADGYINPKMAVQTYIKSDPSFSPVIHFRWGYKANKEELKLYGDKIFLNEQNYWGGGPFANGCSSLPDLWNVGLNDRLFLWITIQHLNSVDGRKVYGTPPRIYGVLAALRLAKLIRSIREKQADVPITVVCHSQGNMVGIAAAFLGERLSEVIDPWKTSGRCVADSYVLCNPPYSLVTELGTDTWAQRGVKDGNGHVGRQTFEARKETLKAYFNILRERAKLEMDAAELDQEMANTRTSASGGKPFNAEDDRQAHGLNGKTYGRVTLYACPHDQVISATTVQGMGWRGLSGDEINATEGHGVFTQRVFATGFTVGEDKPYRYWDDDWRYGKGKTPGFWYPPSPKARFALGRALHAHETFLPKVMTTLSAPILYLFNFTSVAVNADPPPKWSVPVNAPKLEEAIRFKPQTIRYGQVCGAKDGDAAVSDFNEDYDRPSAARNKDKTDKQADDPYDQYDGPSKASQAQGSVQDEAGQRYEDHAVLRMEARRHNKKGWVDQDGKVTGEDDPQQATEDYKKWHNQQITDILVAGEHNNPTNHSTIMTNPMHAERALAYDVAIGVCYLSEQDLRDLRIAADWRFVKGLGEGHPNWKFEEYFRRGEMGGKSLQEWVVNDKEAHMPDKIKNERDGGFMLKVGDFFL
ncbi:conserved hypothethical protein (plasmid) [Ralstonia solanacearum CMR15]|nr:conserved hypothethical protein [Ralstonia solanacearum CMR15]